MKKLTLKQMNEMAKNLGLFDYTDAESVFRHGLHCLQSSEAAIKADRENPIKYQMNRIINDLHDIQIAENILREWYGIQFCNIGTHRGESGMEAQLYNGIDELSRAMGKEPEETNDWQLRKSFDYDWCKIVQLAERNSTNYKKAFDGNPKNYSTTYEKAYGVKRPEDEIPEGKDSDE